MGSVEPPTYEIQGQEVRLPVVVREAISGTATYLVSSAAARKMLPGDAFDVVELLPGRALFSLAMIDYRDNDLGDYNEVSVAFVVRERSARRGIPYLGAAIDVARGNLATFIQWLPVTQSFTRDAGSKIWGFPKTIAEIEIDARSARATCTLRAEGKHVLTLCVPRGGTRSLPESAMQTYTYIDGAPHRTRFTSSAEGFGFSLGGAELRLGDHPFADELRRLGLPKRALATTWMERMRGRFEAAEKL